jgi:hypothetical protein
MRPGEKHRLTVSISLARHFPAGVPINLTFIWTARATLFESWPWMVLLVLALFDLGIATLWLREVRRWRREAGAAALPGVAGAALVLAVPATLAADFALVATGQASVADATGWSGLGGLSAGFLAVLVTWLLDRRRHGSTAGRKTDARPGRVASSHPSR